MRIQKCALRKIEYDAKRHLYQPNGYWVDYAMADKVLSSDFRGEEIAEFYPAYIVSTEMDLPRTIRLFDNNPRDVLTVAGSGDQAMFYVAAGVQNVDTFDMTFGAKVIMDIKTAALQKMERGEYSRFINSLYKIEDLKNDNTVCEVVKGMPADTAAYVMRMTGSQIFGKFRRPPGLWDTWIPSDAEYAKMQNVIKDPFNFIWTDITDLHTHLHKTYDVINISNIFDWRNKKTVPHILQQLFDKLNVGGYIFAMSFVAIESTRPWFVQAESELGGRARFVDKICGDYILTLHKVR